MVKQNAKAPQKTCFHATAHLKRFWTLPKQAKNWLWHDLLHKTLSEQSRENESFLVLWQFSFIITYKFYEVNYVKKSFFRLLWHALVCFGNLVRATTTYVAHKGDADLQLYK